MKREEGWYLYDKKRKKKINGPSGDTVSPSWCKHIHDMYSNSILHKKEWKDRMALKNGD